MSIPLWRRAAAELTGTAALVTTVAGSGIMAQRLSADGAIQLLANSTATVFGLAVLIAVFGPVSGAHFNQLFRWPTGGWAGALAPACGQTSLLSMRPARPLELLPARSSRNLMFKLPAVAWSQTPRTEANLWLAEIVATTGLLVVIVSLLRNGKTAVIPAAVGAYIGAAYWFTASTSFANPAVTIGRAFTDTYAGIAPASVPGFVAAQVIGMVYALGLIAVVYPSGPAETTAMIDETAAAERQPEHV